jgi:uncharacterized protein YkwD
VVKLADKAKDSVAVVAGLTPAAGYLWPSQAAGQFGARADDFEGGRAPDALEPNSAEMFWSKGSRVIDLRDDVSAGARPTSWKVLVGSFVAVMIAIAAASTRQSSELTTLASERAELSQSSRSMQAEIDRLRSQEGELRSRIDTLAAQQHNLLGASSQGARATALDYIERVNDFRSERSLSRLSQDDTLTLLSMQHSAEMATANDLNHTADLQAEVTFPWSKLGEVVGMGPTPDTTFRAFVNGPEQVKNMADPAFNSIGVGVAWSGGVQWVTIRFAAKTG